MDTGARRVVLNLLANVGGLLVTLAVGMWWPPYLIKHLGVATYGMVPLSNQVTNYLTLVTVAVTGAVGRYLTIDLERGDVAAANRTFNTALVACLLLMAVLWPVGTGLAVVAPSLLSTPVGQETAVRWLFAASVAVFVLNVLSSAFGVCFVARNRLDLRQALAVALTVVRIGTVPLLFVMCGQARLEYVAAGLLASGVVRQGLVQLAWRRLTPELHIRLREYDRTRLREFLTMGGWMTLNQLGTLLFLNVDLLVVNLMLGAKTGGAYGAVLQWSGLLRTLSGVLGSVLQPVILAYHARDDAAGIIRVSQQAVRVMGLAMALPIAVVAGLSRPLLHLWLGQEFAAMSWLMVVLTVHLSVNLAVLPLLNVQVALNRVRLPGVVQLFAGVANVGLAYLLTGPVGWGVYGVAGAGAIVLTAKNALFTPLYAAHIMGRPWHTFMLCMLPSVAATLLLGTAAFWLSSSVDLVSWPRIIGVAAALSVLYLPLAWVLGLSEDDRRIVRRLLPGRHGRSVGADGG